MHIVFDIGGTKMRLAASRDGESLDKTVIVETPLTYEEGLEKFKQATQTLCGGEQIDIIAGGMAGPYNQDKGVLVGGPNLKDWIGRPFKSEIETTFNAPVYLENDSALAGLGEATRGAGRSFRIVAYMTVSTGVGGVRIVDGKIDAKSIGFEPGHQIIDADKTIIPDADGIFFQNYISGKSLSARTGKKPKEIKEGVVWDGLAKLLAYGLNNTCVFWSPDVIVLGGSMITGDPAIPIDRVSKYLGEILKIYPSPPLIVKSEHGDLAGLYGALEYIKLKSRT